MPGGDRTGPAGMGSRTGRAFGFCEGFDVPGYAEARGIGQEARGMQGATRRSPAQAGGQGAWGMGRGPCGMGRRRGAGQGRGFNAGFGFGNHNQGQAGQWPVMPELSRDDEVNMLNAQVASIERSKQSLEKRLEELSKE